MPLVYDIDIALETVFSRGDEDREAFAIEGVEFFQEFYHWPVVFEQYWKPLLERIEGELW
jgi:hypothetical protein